MIKCLTACLIKGFDELKEGKYFKEIADFKKVNV